MNRKAWAGLCLVVILLATWALGPVPAFAMDEDNLSGITEVKAGIGYTIQFASGDGSGSMEPVFWTKREAYELPPCAFTAPEKKAFKEWSVVIGDAEAVSKQPNETIEVTANTTVTAVWEDVGDSVILHSATVMFQGMIAIRYRYTIPDSILNTGYIVFEKSGAEVGRTALSKGELENGYRYYYYKVLIPEYADTVVTRLVDSENNPIPVRSAQGTDYTDGLSYSAKTYAEHKKQDSSDPKMQALAQALDDYGTAAQIHFKYGDYQNLSVRSEVKAVTADQIGEENTTYSGNRPSWVEAASVTLFFQTDNRLRTYFKVGDGSFTYTLDDVGKTASVYTDGRHYLDVNAIAAPELGRMHTFAVSNGEETYWIRCSGMTYAKRMIQNSEDTMKDLARALYLYYQAASAYFPTT